MENLSKRKLVTNDIIKTPEVMGHMNKYSQLVSSESEVHIFVKSTTDKTELFPVLRAEWLSFDFELISLVSFLWLEIDREDTL